MIVLSSPKTLLVIYAALALAGCKTGSNRNFDASNGTTEVGCTQNISNSQANSTTQAIFDNLVELSCGAATQDGVIMGQSLGNGNQLVSEDDKVSYEALVEALKIEPVAEDDKGAGDTAALLSIDYELDQIYSAAEIEEAHVQLKEHWDEGGIVSISWTPLNPWTNPGTSVGGNAEQTEHTSAVDLAALLNNSTEISTTWNNRLIFIADQLAKLQTLGVTVLWRPFPEMNDDRYWYGVANITEEDNSEETVQRQIKNLWIDMYVFFNTRNLNNLLWVYSPAESDFMADTQPADWAFPQDEGATNFDKYVDIVAPVVLDDSLLISDYDELLELERPMGLARLSPKERTQEEEDERGKFADGSFDNESYIKLRGDPAIAFWVSWHDYQVDGSTNVMSLINNQNTKALVDNENTISLEKFVSRGLRNSN